MTNINDINHMLRAAIIGLANIAEMTQLTRYREAMKRVQDATKIIEGDFHESTKNHPGRNPCADNFAISRRGSDFDVCTD